MVPRKNSFVLICSLKKEEIGAKEFLFIAGLRANKESNEMSELKSISRLVVKFGTESLSLSGKLDQKVFNDFARQIIIAQGFGIRVAIVSSGAIRAGQEAMGALGAEPYRLEKKHLAGIGARHLMEKWGKAFRGHRKEVAMVWITYASLMHDGERRSIKDSIICYLENGVVPVINENDVLSDEEIRWMDEGISENDKLAQEVAFLIEANSVLFITTQGGIYENNPKVYPEAKLYKEINCDCAFDSVLNANSVSEGGAGGMKTKLKAACKCAQAGKRVAVAGKEENIILNFAKGLPVGTSIKHSKPKVK
ncbi:hypothetical protein FJ208_00460 [Candidatus Gribaldobacteria bacterium]|nr:hypothetical protein [Candidatus Gribaldobacteria bacterium]